MSLDPVPERHRLTAEPRRFSNSRAFPLYANRDYRGALAQETIDRIVAEIEEHLESQGAYVRHDSHGTLSADVEIRVTTITYAPPPGMPLTKRAIAWFREQIGGLGPRYFGRQPVSLDYPFDDLTKEPTRG